MTETENEEAHSSWPAWQWAGLVVLALTIGGYAVAESLFGVAHFAGLSLGSGEPGIALFRAVCALVIAGFGALLMTRARRNRAAGLLGIMLLSMATQVAPLPPFKVLNSLTLAFLFILALRSFCIGYFWPIFCLEISGGPASRRQWLFVQVGALVFAFMPIPALWASVANRSDIATTLWIVLILGNQFLGYWILAGNYRRNEGVGRNRIKIAFFAFLFFLTSSVAAALNLLASAAFEPALSIVTATTSLAGAALFAYAVLRRRLFDFSFALNRTLVYGAISFILLAGFGLAEWAVDHLIPEEWHRQSALYSACIALILFLSFHRLRDWVERQVERLFFHAWHHAETELKRFVASAAHFRQAPALCREFVAETQRFAQGARAALYLRRENGDYERQCGALDDAPELSVDEDRVLVLMRAEQGAVDMNGAHSRLPGALALPMLDQLGLAGFLLLATRPDGANYRPDEIANLAWATQQVGLDLQALEARELRAEIACLRNQLAQRAVRKLATVRTA